MASSPSILLAVAALAALLAVGSCGTLKWTIGKDSDEKKLVLVASDPVSEVAVRPKGADDFLDDLKEDPEKTFTYESKEPIKGPISVRFAVKGAGYRVDDDVIPADFKPGDEIDTKEKV